MPLKTFTSKNFTGRKNELQILQKIASRAIAGDANSVLLLGERGIGKTELLAHVFNHLFWNQSDTIPFFYTINPACMSSLDFSRDYVCKFIMQAIAFLKKDPFIINTSICSLEDLFQLAKDSGSHWAIEMIDDYVQLHTSKEPRKLYMFAASLPHRSFFITDRPVVVMIDDFHKARGFHASEPGNDKKFWMLFENSMKYRYTPHVMTGSQAELKKMFFQETSIGDCLEMINILPLNSDESLKLFASLCETHSLRHEDDVTDILDVFNGNPFYLKSFVQMARQKVRTLTREDFWKIYTHEITKGKIFTYWTSLLKMYVPQFRLRKPVINFLYGLSRNSVDIDVSRISETLSIDQETFEDIREMLEDSGAIKTAFSLIELSGDQILLDLIEGLYQREVQKKSLHKVGEAIIRDKRLREPLTGEPSVDMTIPSFPRAELVVVKSLEQIAHYFEIPSGAVGQLQVALVELFNTVLSQDRSAVENYPVKFRLKEDVFSVEIVISQKDFALAENGRDRVKAYLDDVKVERVFDGTRITLLREIKKDFVSAS